MPGKGHNPEQILNKLRQVEVASARFQCRFDPGQVNWNQDFLLFGVDQPGARGFYPQYLAVLDGRISA